MKPAWVLVKDKDDELTVVARIDVGDPILYGDDRLTEIANQDKSAKYHMCKVLDTWVYPQDTKERA